MILIVEPAWAYDGQHVFLRHRPGECEPPCPICEGGLGVCVVCGETECDLATVCPGTRRLVTVTMATRLHTRLRELLRDRSVYVGDFPLASGGRSRYYIDARHTTMSGEGLDVVGTLALERLEVRGWEPRFVGGLTLGADPVAYAIAVAARNWGRSLDAFTVRKQPKDHGTAKRIEGCFATGAAVVVVEDVITTGQSALEAIRAVKSEGAHVLGVLAVVNREAGGQAALEQAGYQVEVLITATELGLA